jgi:hypothetical protein
MTFTYEPITPADKEQVDALNIRVRHAPPNTRNWVVNRENGDFLIWIGPEREPPHWTLFGFRWKGRLFGVGLKEQWDYSTRYHLEIASVWDEEAPVFSEWSDDFKQSLFEAVKVFARVEASAFMKNWHQRAGLPYGPTDAPPIVLETRLNDLRNAPVATYSMNFPRCPK